ncbi:type II secretion system protein [Streptomyces sp. Isolate_45]|uniref:type IV pilus modification PilV family protein n=1 Tax=Streptomyces sp. Isolate_45 TaxID=2950111 RepID=UPI002481DF75|nr:type II secretion system protein [Streptomyces sp. Isolate_45]MDA5280899.1 type II secretion system protein [Streptomyces sp. Isolate_45]
MTGPARRPARGPQRRRGEEGETLIEVLVAVVLMGVAFAAILGGMGTALISSVTQQKLTSADSVIRSAAERVVSDPYVSCASGYETSTPPAGYTVTVEVEYWDGVGAFGQACPTADTGVQKVTLTVRSAGPRPVRDVTLEVVKRESMLS